MTIKIVGDTSSIEKIPTGCYTLDRALKGGYPLQTLSEISGSTFVGKSTFAYFIAGCIAKNNIVIADMEGSDKNYVATCISRTGYDETVTFIPVVENGKPRLSKDIVQDGIDMLAQRKAEVLIVDSVGAYVPQMEANTDVDEGYNTRRAAEWGRIARRLLVVTQSTPTCSLIVNHVHANLTGYGTSTSGGVTLKYLCQVRISLRVDEVIKSKEEPIAYSMIGKIDKLKYGGVAHATFRVVNIPGVGIDRNITKVFDCFALGIAKRDTGGMVKLQDKRVARLSTLIEGSINRKDNMFDDFSYELEEYKYRHVGEEEKDVEPVLDEEISDEENKITEDRNGDK